VSDEIYAVAEDVRAPVPGISADRAGVPPLLTKIIVEWEIVRVTSVQLLARSDQIKAALPPIRRQLLGLLGEPASASELARRTGIARQKINYHLRVLEQVGLVELVETRARRGCTERVLRATSDELVIDPQAVGPSTTVRSRDRFAAEHLADAAARTVRDVTRLRHGAERTDRRLLTFTVEADVTFAQPADVHAFTADLAEAISDLATRHGSTDGRRYRVLVGGHPAADPAAPQAAHRSTDPSSDESTEYATEPAGSRPARPIRNEST
jgi:DNA-binding transcriptional ArsR family regulator